MRSLLASGLFVLVVGCGAKASPPAAVSAPPPAPEPAPTTAEAPATPTPEAPVRFVEDPAARGLWKFETPKLPALDAKTGEVVVPDRGDDRYAFAAGLELSWLAPGSKKSARTITVLAQSEYRAVFHEAPAEETDGRAAALAATVRARAARASAELGGVDLRALTACAVTDAPPRKGEKPEPASVHCGRPQAIDCGKAAGRYAGGTLEWRSGDRSSLVKPGWERPAIPASRVASMTRGRAVAMEMGECLSEAHFDEASRVLVTRVQYACKATAGDWCSYPPAWRAVKLD
ncbi:MAG: hypothetical protein JNL38_03265 [Myxococcales bacterium]|nr:hypothetical protein [Myxococcales bacterium]